MNQITAKSAATDGSLRKSIEHLVGGLAGQIPLLEAQQSGAELYCSPRLNAFNLFAPGENDLSRLAEDLLDPLGALGQGILFLNAFLGAVGVPEVGHGSAVRVRREALTPGRRRIDLLIETSEALVGIENKPWASQGRNQLADYLAAIKRWAGSKTARLVFLSNQKPETAKDEVLVMPFVSEQAEPSFRSILADSLGHIRSPRTKTHVEEFIMYLDEEFGDGAVSDLRNEVFMDAVKLYAADRPSRKAVAALLLSSDALHENIINEIGDYFLNSLKALHADFTVEDNLSFYTALSEKWYPWKARRSSWPANLAIAFEAGQHDFKQVFFGVLAPNSAIEHVEEGIVCSVRELVEPALTDVNGGKPSKHWAWWAWPFARNWDYEFAARAILDSPTSRVEDNPEVRALSERLVALAATVEQAMGGSAMDANNR